MKGQRLFVREASDGDAAAIAELLELQPGSAPPAADLWFVSKLVGRYVACASLSRDEQQSATLTRLAVTPELRGKRIGQLTLREIETSLRSSGLGRLVIRRGVVPESFALRAGYVPDADSFVKQLEADPA